MSYSSAKEEAKKDRTTAQRSQDNCFDINQDTTPSSVHENSGINIHLM